MSRLLIFAVGALAAMGYLAALESVPKTEYRQRRTALAAKLNGGFALLFASEESQLDFMPYRQDSDFYYLSGWREPGAALLVIGAGEATMTRLGDKVPAHSYREILFLPGRNRVMEKYTGVKMDAATAGIEATTGFDNVMPMTALPQVLAGFLGEDRRRTASVWSQPEMPAATAALRFTAAALGMDGVFAAQDAHTPIMGLRSVKSEAEIALIRKATDASMDAQRAGMRAVEPGVREGTVAGIEIETMMANGCERPSYAPIVGSGVNATTLHYSANENTMERGDLVVIDAAGEFSMYASDITRTLPISGRFSERQREIYEIVLAAQRAAAAAFVAGQSKMGSVMERGPDVKDTLDKVAFDYINTHGKDSHGQPLGKYFLHGLGHSVGIDVHDPMDYSKPLDKGMVFTIEPGVYIPEEKIGVRIEDIYYVDSEGKLVDLVEKLPHEARDVEGAMRGR